MGHVKTWLPYIADQNSWDLHDIAQQQLFDWRKFGFATKTLTASGPDWNTTAFTIAISIKPPIQCISCIWFKLLTIFSVKWSRSWKLALSCMNQKSILKNGPSIWFYAPPLGIVKNCQISCEKKEKRERVKFISPRLRGTETYSYNLYSFCYL